MEDVGTHAAAPMASAGTRNPISSACARTAGIAKRGVANLLRHAGILSGQPEIAENVVLDMPDERCYVTSRSSGLVEFLFDLGIAHRLDDVA